MDNLFTPDIEAEKAQPKCVTMGLEIMEHMPDDNVF